MTQRTRGFPGAEPAAGARGGRIVELHGLRGMALALVVVFHLFGNGRVSGGVDVFLVISGFLLTLSLLRRAENGGIRLVEQYGKMAVRLAPPALITLAGVAVLTVALFPTSRWVEVGREIVASALYYENWALIAHQLSYGAAGPDASPLQHFWSLSLQGQFFLLWPVTILALAWLAHRCGSSTTLLAAIFLTSTTAASFAYALHLTAIDQPVAYFHSLTRYWELGVGALLAIALPHLRIPDTIRAVISWIGLGLILSSGFLIDGAQHFPGLWTLWPVVGALFVLAGAGSATKWGPRAALQLRPLRFVADISYSLYLWHWPLLVFYLQFRDYPGVGWRGATGLLVLSVLLAWLTELLISRPSQELLPRFGHRPSLVVAVAATTAVAIAGTTAIVALETRQAAAIASLAKDSPHHPGAAGLEPGGDSGPWPVPFRPSTETAREDTPSRDADCSQSGLLEICVSHAPARPRKTVVISGGSHARQWEPAMKIIAEQAGWTLLTMAKAGCRLAVGDAVGTNAGPKESCTRWRQSALEALIEMSPDAVFTIGTLTPGGSVATEVVQSHQVEAWRELTSSGVPVLAMRDNPRFPRRVPECVQRYGPTSNQCTIKRADALAVVSPALTPEATLTDVHHIDLSDWICDSSMCPVVTGNVLVYRDAHHFTATYMRTLAPYLYESIRNEMPGLF